MPVIPLFCPGAVIAMALLCSCAGVPSPHAPAVTRSAVSAAKTQAACRVARRLAEQRAHFLAGGDLKDAFSAFYWHVTTAILEMAHNGTLPDASLILEMVEDFYGEYERHRSAARRESHWEPYYALAATEKSAADFALGRRLIQFGVNAHIDHDLPRILTRLFQRHPELRGRRLDTLYEAFQSLDTLFLPCSVQGFNDLATVLPNAPGRRAILAQSYIARAIIRHKRHRAWIRTTQALR